jgi:hypothetical protein
MISAIWAVALEAFTWRLTSGSGSSRLTKKASDMGASSCWPVWISVVLASGRVRSSATMGAIFTKLGRAPTMTAIFNASLRASEFRPEESY